MDVIIYHNPSCGTSRNALEMIRNAGIEPTVIECLKTPPSREQLTNMIEDAGLTVRAVLSKWPPLGAKANLFRVSTRKAGSAHRVCCKNFGMSRRQYQVSRGMIPG
jgi:arsenate reductase-like glutaredoxin family protein